MSNTIQHFGLSQNQIIKEHGEFYLPISVLSEVLKITPQSIYQTIKRYREDFGEALNYKFKAINNSQSITALNEEQVYTLCMISRSEKAREFRRAFAQTIKQIRQKEYIHISELAGLIEQKFVLRDIPVKKLNRYKKFRKLGLNRKECCKAFNLPYSRMKQIDKILGFYKPPTEKVLKVLKANAFKKQQNLFSITESEV